MSTTTRPRRAPEVAAGTVLDQGLADNWTLHDTPHSTLKREEPHIWANHFEHHLEEFDNRSDFDYYRNCFGALLLLPKDFNASFGDMPYGQKVEHYRSQNPLASSLHPMAYENNPSFRRLRETRGLSFKAYPTTFSKDAIDERQSLYQELAEIVWDPARLGLG